MSKSAETQELVKQSYKGHCRSCGEIYVVQTGEDDLEGMIFSCKKVGCSGKIDLKVEDEHQIFLNDKKSLNKIKFH